MNINPSKFESIARSHTDAVKLFRQLIQQLVLDTEASAGIVWNCQEAPFRPLAEHTNGTTIPVRLSETDHLSLLTQVMEQQKSAILRPNHDQSPESSPVMLLSPVCGPARLLIELILPQKVNDNYESVLGQVDDVSRMIAGRLVVGRGDETDERKMDEAPESATAANGPDDFGLEKFSQYVRSLHKSIDKRLTCANIANETRRLLDCDRVTVVLWNRGSFRTFAISGQPSVNQRSSTVYLLEKLSQQILKSENPFWYPDDQELAPQIKSILDEYLGISATRSLVIHPIREKVSELVEDPESNEKKDNPIIGGIIYEHCNEQWDAAAMAPRLEFVTHHVGDALRNAKKHHDIFLYPLWNLLSKSRVLTAPRVLPKTLLVLGAILLTVLTLAFWQVPFYVSAKGVLVPQNRKWVFPQTTGEVTSVVVDHGTEVSEDQVLVHLKSEELELRVQDVSGRIETLEQRKSAIERAKFESAGIPGQSTSSENIKSLVAEIDSLKTQLALLEEMKSKLQIKSPMDGQVITWDVRQKLEGRTVQPQQILLEVADPNGPWQIELDVDDRRVGHLLRSMPNGDEKLRVVFTLAADPNRTYEGHVIEVANAMRLSADNEQMIRVRVEIDEDAIELKQAKTGVSAKIYCGYKTSIGYLWLHDIPETFRQYVLFYFEG